MNTPLDLDVELSTNVQDAFDQYQASSAVLGWLEVWVLHTTQAQFSSSFWYNS